VIIDVHSHIFPPEYMRRIADLGGRLPQLSAAPLSGMKIGERLELMEREGVEIGVLSVGVLQPYHADRRTAADLARQANDLFLATGAESAGRLLTFMALPLPHVDAAVEELDRLAGVEGVVGITLGTSVLEHELDDKVLFPLYEALNARASTVFVHPSMTFAGFGPRDLGMSRTIGAMFEDTIAAVRLLLSGVCVRYPDINFIIPHLGGTLPFIYGRVGRHLQRCEDEWNAAGLTSRDDPNQGIARLWYDTAVRHAPALTCAYDTVGPDRLLFGTDFPYLKSREELGVRIGNIRDLPLSDVQRDAILGDQAAKLLGIKPE
jgi:aminocarboxymuconate-semialdehyde decarboxylase